MSTNVLDIPAVSQIPVVEVLPEVKTYEITKEKQHETVRDLARQIGHDSWIAQQRKDDKTILAFPNKIPFKKYGGKYSRTGLMSFETLKDISSNIQKNEDGKFTVNPDLTIETFYQKLVEEGLTDEELKFVTDLKTKIERGDADGIQLFTDWMIEAGTLRILDNDAWGMTALGYLEYNNIDLNNLSDNQKADLVKLKTGIDNYEVTSAEDLVANLTRNGPLAVAMMIAHKNWRRAVHNCKYDGMLVVPTDNFKLDINELPDELKIQIESFSANLIKNQVTKEGLTNLLKDVAKSTEVSDVNSYLVMIHLAELIEDQPRPWVQAISELHDLSLDNIRYDANPAIYKAIFHAYKEIHGHEIAFDEQSI